MYELDQKEKEIFLFKLNFIKRKISKILKELEIKYAINKLRGEAIWEGLTTMTLAATTLTSITTHPTSKINLLK